jgi:hypothetical protein
MVTGTDRHGCATRRRDPKSCGNTRTVTRQELERRVLADEAHGAEAREVVRGLIGRITVGPAAEGKGVDLVLEGELAAILAACAGAQHANARLGAGVRRMFRVVM